MLISLGEACGDVTLWAICKVFHAFLTILKFAPVHVWLAGGSSAAGMDPLYEAPRLGLKHPLPSIALLHRTWLSLVIALS